MKKCTTCVLDSNERTLLRKSKIHNLYTMPTPINDLIYNNSDQQHGQAVSMIL